jgi:hypothetical protein
LCLCITQKSQRYFFNLAHDQNNHHGIHKTYAKLAANYFIPQLSQRLRQYIQHCPQCQTNATLRDKQHGLLHPIQSPPIPFHSITMDFIVGLPPTTQSGHGNEIFDSILTIVDKFSKAVLLLVGKSTYNATNWANQFWMQVYPIWGFPNVMITDRDPKFVSEFWTSLFQKANIRSLCTTAYHPQADGQSERINQSIEITLCHYVNARSMDALIVRMP